MKVLRSWPNLPVADIPAAETFLHDCLGFETVHRNPSHVLLRRDAATVALINAPPDADMDDPARQLVLYLDVDDTDAFFQHHRAALEALPPGAFRAPFDQPHGQREMHVIHGPFLFMLGNPIESTR